MLQRVYGTAWATKDELQQYLTMLEEAEKRDHRKLGRELDLFHIDDHAPGLVFWHPKGWTLWQGVEQYMRKVYRDNGYLEVKGPQIWTRACGRRPATGTSTARTCSRPSRKSANTPLKPMNCPGHILIFKQGIKSYRDLPLALRRVWQVPPQRAFGACTASCACAASRRMMATFSVPKTRS
jgi:threonyl-tRNA synthetase